MLFAGLKRGAYGPHNERKPDQQPCEQQGLPAAAEIDVLVTLMTPIKRHAVRKLVRDREPFTGHRSSNHNQKCQEKNIDAEPLSPGLLSANQRADEQAGGEPCGGYPEYSKLDVPGPGHAVGKPAGERNTVKPSALDTVMRDHNSNDDLRQNESGNDPEILQCRALRWSWLPAHQRILRKKFRKCFAGFSGSVPPHHRRYSRKQHDDAHAGPKDCFAGGAVADQLLVRPIMGICDRVAGTVRGGTPGRPENEGRKSGASCRVRDRAGRNGVCGFAFVEHIPEVRGYRFKSSCADFVDNDDVAFWIVSVGAIQGFETAAQA